MRVLTSAVSRTSIVIPPKWLTVEEERSCGIDRSIEVTLELNAAEGRGIPRESVALDSREAVREAAVKSRIGSWLESAMTRCAGAGD